MNKRRLAKLVLLSVSVLMFGIMMMSNAHAVIENVTSSELVNGSAETRLTGGAGSIVVEGGNITEWNVSKQQQTQWFQGVWGQVTVNLTLNDASGNVFYNWTEADATGEIYFYNGSITSFNLNESSAANTTYAQTVYNWANSTNVDNLSNTFTNISDHSDFNASTVQMNRTQNVQLTGSQVCTMLWRTDIQAPLWAALISQDQTIFNTQTADYQCLLPVRTLGGIETFFVYSELI